jgi:hypothetical protein
LAGIEELHQEQFFWRAGQEDMAKMIKWFFIFEGEI